MTPSWGDYGTHRHSVHPELWEGCVGAWCPSLGPTGSMLYDLSGRNNHASVVNSTLSTTWPVGTGRYALNLDGINDYAKAVNTTVTYPISFSLWANGGLGSNRRLFTLTNAADAEMRLSVYTLGGSGPQMQAYNTSGNNQITSSATSILSSWGHVACVFWSDTLRQIYVNGSLKATSTASVSISGDMSRLLIGTLEESTEFFSGWLDDIMLFDRPLYQEDITKLASQRGAAYERRKVRYFSFETDSSPPPAAASYKPRKTFSRVVP